MKILKVPAIEKLKVLGWPHTVRMPLWIHKQCYYLNSGNILNIEIYQLVSWFSTQANGKLLLIALLLFTYFLNKKRKWKQD